MLVKKGDEPPRALSPYYVAGPPGFEPGTYGLRASADFTRYPEKSDPLM